MSKMSKEKICKKCTFPITKKEKYVLIGTYEDKNVIEEIYFHINCWREYFNQKVIECSKRNVGATLQKVIPRVKEVLYGTQ